jgi:hypothetical protein
LKEGQGGDELDEIYQEKVQAYELTFLALCIE